MNAKATKTKTVALEDYRSEYKQVCDSFRLLTDIRFKLLAFLPVGTAAGVTLASSVAPIDIKFANQLGFLIAVIGLIVTCGIAFYNKRNDQLYDELVARAAELERILGLKEGSFATRPRDWAKAGPFAVNHDKIWWVYAASIAAWIFVFFNQFKLMDHLFRLFGIANADAWRDPLAFALALGIVAFAFHKMNEGINDRRKAMRRAASDCMAELVKLDPSDAETDDHRKAWHKFISHIWELSGRPREQYSHATKTWKAIKFYCSDHEQHYWDRPKGGDPMTPDAAAQLIGLLSDLPPRWIRDVTSGRR